MPAVAFAQFGDRTLHTGSSGHDVKVLQSWLSHMGFATGVDGSFGRNTRWNLRRFEQAKHLRINLGRREVRITKNGKRVTVPAGSDPIGFDFRPTVTRVIPPSQKRPCG